MKKTKAQKRTTAVFINGPRAGQTELKVDDLVMISPNYLRPPTKWALPIKAKAHKTITELPELDEYALPKAVETTSKDISQVYHLQWYRVEYKVTSVSNVIGAAEITAYYTWGVGPPPNKFVMHHDEVPKKKEKSLNATAKSSGTIKFAEEALGAGDLTFEEVQQAYLKHLLKGKNAK